MNRKEFYEDVRLLINGIKENHPNSYYNENNKAECERMLEYMRQNELN